MARSTILERNGFDAMGLKACVAICTNSVKTRTVPATSWSSLSSEGSLLLPRHYNGNEMDDEASV